MASIIVILFDCILYNNVTWAGTQSVEIKRTECCLPQELCDFSNPSVLKPPIFIFIHFQEHLLFFPSNRFSQPGPLLFNLISPQRIIYKYTTDRKSVV